MNAFLVKMFVLEKEKGCGGEGGGGGSSSSNFHSVWSVNITTETGIAAFQT